MGRARAESEINIRDPYERGVLISAETLRRTAEECFGVLLSSSSSQKEVEDPSRRWFCLALVPGLIGLGTWVSGCVPPEGQNQPPPRPGATRTPGPREIKLAAVQPSGGGWEESSQNRLAEGIDGPGIGGGAPETPPHQPTSTPDFTPTPEVIQAPRIKGLRAVKEGDKIVYRAEEGNPYGLEKEAFAGYLYPEAYILDPETNFETEQQIGAVGLRAEVVRTLLEKAGYPNKIVFPIPFDISYANNPREKVIIWEAKTTEEDTFLMFHLPEGSSVVASLPNENNQTRIRISPHPWERVFVDFERGRAFSGKYKGFGLTVGFSNDRLEEGKEIALDFGDRLSEASLKGGFTYAYMGYLGQYFTIPKKLKKAEQRLNVIIDSHTVVEPIRLAVITKENLLRIGNSPVFILANDNPLF